MSHSEEERDDILKELERIEGMTPDQAYRESVSTLGRADGITDRMDAAARIPESELDALRKTSAVQRPETSAPTASAPDARPADAGRDVSYRIVRADDPGIAEYHKRREAQRSASMAAWRAAVSAQQRTRDELLASGRYFDDGRGNLKLRKKFREYTRRGSNGRPYGDTLPDDGSGNAAIRNAGQDAYDRTIAEYAQPPDGGRAEAFLRQDQRNADELKAARQRRRSSINLIGSRILAQSLRAMNEPDDNTSGGARYTNGDRNGVEIKRGYGTSRLAERGSGGYKVGGFVSEEQLKEFNDELNAQGADFAVTGVVCQQKKDANGYESGRPHFYIQFRHKNGREFARMYSIEKAYDEARRAFKDHYQGSSYDEADDYAIKAFGDIFGRGAKREEAVQRAQSKEDANNKKIVLQGLFDIAKQQKDRAPMTAREAWQRGMSDPKFIEAWMTKPNPDEVSAEQTPRIPLETEEEVAAAMKKFEAAYGELESGGGNGAMNPFQERVLAIADRVLGPAPVDPGAAASTPASAQQQQAQAARQSDNGDTHTDERGTWQAVRDANGNIVGKKLISKPAAQSQQQPSAPLSQPVTSLESPAPAQQPKEKSPQDHINLILRDRRLSKKEKEARIAYWRRIQQRNADKSAEELGVDVNDDLAMLEAELNGPSETMIASN